MVYRRDALGESTYELVVNAVVIYPCVKDSCSSADSELLKSCCESLLF